jgi:hypothetical protein
MSSEDCSKNRLCEEIIDGKNMYRGRWCSDVHMMQVRVKVWGKFLSHSYGDQINSDIKSSQQNKTTNYV